MFHHVLPTGLRTEIHQQNVITARLCIWTADLFDRHNIQNIQAHRQRLFRCWCRGTHHVLNRSVPQKSLFLVALCLWCGWSAALPCCFSSTGIKMV